MVVSNNVNGYKSYHVDKWVNGILNDYYVLNNNNVYSSYNDFAKDCLFFMTMTFDRRLISKIRASLGLGYQDFSIEWDNFHLIYNFAAEHLFGKNFRRNVFVNKLPLAIASVDFEGSRGLVSTGENAHIHALWLVHPNCREQFVKLISSVKFKLRFLPSLHSDKVRFDQFDPQRKGQKRLGSYATKSFLQTKHKPTNGNILRIYPNANYNPIVKYKTGNTYTGKRNYASERLFRIATVEKKRLAKLNEWRSVREPILDQ